MVLLLLMHINICKPTYTYINIFINLYIFMSEYSIFGLIANKIERIDIKMFIIFLLM